MKTTYPIVVSKGQKYLIVYVPDFDIKTQGKNLTDAIEMARDVIGLAGIVMEDENEPLPEPSDFNSVKKKSESDIVTLVDVDFDEYRKKNDTKTVRRNVTLPSWLDFEAKQSGINVSAVLQKALKKELHITNR